MQQDPAFTPDLFAFLRELAANNDRDWFNASKARYEEVAKEPALAFIEDMALRLPEDVSPNFVGSLFRIHRDVRFARDKAPYKTHVGIYFKHVQHADMHTPMYYLHLEPGRVFVGAGVWRPDRELLRRIRDRIAGRPDLWHMAAGDPAFAAAFPLAGDTLKRAPAGFPADHPEIEALRRKDFVGLHELTEADAVSPAFLDTFVGLAATAEPFMRFLCECSDVSYR